MDSALTTRFNFERVSAMNTVSIDANTVRNKRQLAIDAALIDELSAVKMPPFVGDSWADKVEYAIHEFIESVCKNAR